MLHHDLEVLITEHSPKHVEISRHRIKVVAELNSLSAWFIVAGYAGVHLVDLENVRIFEFSFVRIDVGWSGACKEMSMIAVKGEWIFFLNNLKLNLRMSKITHIL